ncbi:hypothetical protein A2U01_0105758, partial [Trifolium medium]|nr:hypothetical protein [Trifolium medium]
MVGSLRYLWFSVGLISRYMEIPRVPRLIADKRILRRVKGAQECGILFRYQNEDVGVKLYG